MPYKKLVLSILFISTSLLTFAQFCQEDRYLDSLFEVEKTYDIDYQQATPYASFFESAYALDVYAPLGDTLSKRPLVIFQFGGGFLIGGKQLPPADDYCSFWAERGYVCVSMEYRLGFSPLSAESAERAVYRAAQDLQASLRFLVANSETYGIDTNNIIISGNSAGAVTSLHNTFMEQDQAPASHTGYGFTLDASDLGGLYSSGNTLLNNREVKIHGLISNWGGISDTNFIGDQPDDMVPTILFHGDQDNLVHYDSGNPFDSPFFPTLYGSVYIARALERADIPYHFETFEGAGHEPELLEPAYLDSICDLSSHFMYKHLLKPNINSFTGNQLTEITNEEIYTIQSDEPVEIICANLTKGTVINIDGTDVSIVWDEIGYDTIQIVAQNDIHAKDTILIPVLIDALSGITEIDNGIDVIVFPNPFMNTISVSSNEKINQLELFDNHGRRMKLRVIGNTIQTDKMASGIYFLHITTKKGSKPVVRKLIKN